MGIWESIVLTFDSTLKLFITILVFIPIVVVAQLKKDDISEWNEEISKLLNTELLQLASDAFPVSILTMNEIQELRKLILEIKTRIPSEIGVSLILAEYEDPEHNLDYRRVVSHLMSERINAYRSSEQLDILLSYQSTFMSPYQEEALRTQAIQASVEVLDELSDNRDISSDRYKDYPRNYLHLLEDVQTQESVRLYSLKAIRSLHIVEFAPPLFQQLSIDLSANPLIARSIMVTLGEWQYEPILEFTIEVLNTTNNQELFNSAAYTLGLFQTESIIEPLVTNIEEGRDTRFAARDAIHRNQILVIDMLTNTDHSKQQLALKASHYIRGIPSDLVNTLLQLLTESKPDFQGQIINRLCRTGSKQIIRQVHEILDRRCSPTIQQLIDYELRKAEESRQIYDGNNHQRTEENPVEVGDAVYRDLGLWGEIFGLIENYNHVALYQGWHPDDPGCSDCVIEASGPDQNDGIQYSSFASISEDPDNPYWGNYTTSEFPDFDARQDFCETARALVEAPITYPDFIYLITFPDCLVYTSGAQGTISIAEIDELRCDGVVEYSYERNGYNVWDQATTPGDHFDISYSTEWADEHNDSPDYTEQCDEEASPLAQRDACESYSHTLMNVCTAVYPPSISYYHQSGSNLVEVTATDQLSGIYSIEWRIGTGAWNTSPIQDDFPEYNHQDVEITLAQSSWITVRATDNAWNISDEVHFYVEVEDPNDEPEIEITSPDDDECDEEFTITWNDSDSDDNANINLYYDEDGYGFNGTLINTNNPIYENDNDSYLWNTSQMPEDRYWVYGVISDGQSEDQDYSPGWLDISHNSSPELTNGIVLPPLGYTNDEFTYSVEYSDADGDPPDEIQVFIDGSAENMHYASERYEYQTYLDEGNYEYYFYCEDGNGGSDRYPPSGTLEGPTVIGMFPPPQNLTAENELDGMVSLAWAPPLDSPPTLDSYKLYRSITSGSDYILLDEFPVEVLTYIDYNVANNQTYYYVITALYLNPAGESIYSNEAAGTPQGRFTISGAIEDEEEHPYQGFSLILSDGDEQTAYTDSEGSYQFAELIGGRTYLVTPQYGDCTFEPPSLSFEDLQQDHNEADFIASCVGLYYSVSGYIGYCGSGQPVSDVELHVFGSQNQVTSTGSTGYYEFPNLIAGGTYTVFPSYDILLDDACISPLDAARVLRYSVGLIELTECQLLLADVTGAGGVTPLDAAKILRYVVGLETDFPVGEIWAFIPHNHSYVNLQQDMMAQNFAAGVYGDVTLDWSSNRSSTSASDEMIALSSTWGGHGDIVSVAMDFSTIDEASSGKLVVRWDSLSLAYHDVDWFDTEEFVLTEKHPQPGGIVLAFAASQPVMANDMRWLLELTISEEAEVRTEVPVRLESVMLDERQISNLKGGSVGVIGGLEDKIQIEVSPNPFNPATNINLSVLEDTRLEISIYNIRGQKVATLHSGILDSGEHAICWDGSDASSGLYFARVYGSDFNQVHKLMLIK